MITPEVEIVATNRIEVLQENGRVSVFSTISRVDPDIIYPKQVVGDFSSFEEGIRVNTKKRRFARAVEFGSKYSRIAPVALSFADVGVGVLQRASNAPENFDFI